MERYHASTTIKSWAEDERPREKLQLKGKAALSDAELVAILLTSGSRNVSALDLAKEILATVQNNLGELGRLGVTDLTRFKGMGPAKAVNIITALELGKRRRLSEAPNRRQVKSSNDVYELIQPVLGELPHEEFWAIYLNASNHVLKKACISRGGITGTMADVRLIFREALHHKATGIILCHNHPSGSIKPSQADRGLTRKIKEAGQLMDLKILDHLIITEYQYYSFADEGIM